MGLKIYDSTGLLKTTSGGSGETNTASNIGTDGVGVWDQKIGVDLQFRHIASTDDEYLTATLDAGDNDIDLEIVGSPAVKVKAVKGTAGTINAGDVVYMSGWSVSYTCIEIELADADDSAKMPAVGIAEDSITNTVSGSVIVVGNVTDDTSGLAVGDAVYVDTTAGAWTTTRPTGTTTAIQTIGRVSQVAASGKIYIAGALRSNDVPNLQDAYFWVGNASNVATAVQMSGDATMANDGAVTVADGADGTAIHDNVASEISAITEKGTPVSADLLIIEDSADSNNKKRVQVGNMPAGSETNSLESVCTGILADEVPVGSGADVATYTGTTGSGNVVRATSPTLVTPALGTPASGNLSNCSDYEGTAVASTGEAGGTKFLREDGDGTCSWQDVPGGSTNALLDGSNHTDTVAQAVTRGSLVYGNSTPAWDELTVGGADTYVQSDGTDVSWGALDISHDSSPTLGGNLALNGQKLTETAANTDLEFTNAGTTTFEVLNVTASQVANIRTDGRLQFRNNTAFQFTLSGTPTTNRVWTLQDTDDTFVGLATSDTLTNKTLTTPTIGDFTNATHDHADAAGGGTIEGTAIASTGETGGTKYLREDGDGTCSWQAVVASEVNDLATDGINGIADDQLAVGTGASTAAYQTLPNGAVSYATAGGTFSQAGASDLSDGTTGSGNIVLATSPTLVTPALGTPASGNLSNCTAYEGTAVASTGEVGGTKFLREDGDGTCSWQTVPGGSTHTLLDNATHTDTATQTVSRGSLVYGDSTPQWNELTIGGANTYLQSDGTDCSWGALDISQDTTPTLGGSLNTGGNSITYAGDQTIDLTGSATRTLTIQNSTASNVTNVDIDGQLSLRDNTAYTLTFNPTLSVANRTITFPDATDTVAVLGLVTTQTFTGPLTFNGAVNMQGGTLRLPGNNTLAAEGEVTVDDTTDQLVYYASSAERVLVSEFTWAHPFLDPSSGDEATTHYTTTHAITGVTAKSICRGSTPSVAWEVRYGSDRSATGTLASSGTTTSTTTIETDTFTTAIGTGNHIWVELDTVTGTVDEFFIQLEFKYTRT